jgi:hypothetical protein
MIRQVGRGLIFIPRKFRPVHVNRLTDQSISVKLRGVLGAVPRPRLDGRVGHHRRCLRCQLDVRGSPPG